MTADCAPGICGRLHVIHLSHLLHHSLPCHRHYSLLGRRSLGTSTNNNYIASVQQKQHHHHDQAVAIGLRMKIEKQEPHEESCQTPLIKMSYYFSSSACSGGRIVSWIIYCWLVWCERKTLFPARNLRSFTSKRTGLGQNKLKILPLKKT